MRNQKVWAGVVLVLLGAVSGMSCQQSEGHAGPDDKAAPTAAPHSAPVSAGQGAKPVVEMEIPSISLSQVVNAANQADAGAEPLSQTAEEGRRQLFLAMKPLQIMLGDWRGTTQKEVGDFKGLDKSHWVWDLKTDRKQPVMVMTSDASPYLREGRLTWLPERKVYQFKVVDPEGVARTLEGAFTQEAEMFQGDDRQSHIKYKLELTQVEPQVQRDAWQLVFSQQENNRYLLEIHKRRGSRYLRVDTVATQREGTSFAKSDEGYGQRECIISGGLGTMTVSYKGMTYWVCCSGCKAAFDEEPAKWIAEFQKKKAAGAM
ncbi:hypothetical protein [Planctomicrobium sp. SH527]|uniref:hypothetical protein n=1 Tax=Planctomicrobium sp. SH527 TaxID=3448123 RepID=UPI003F5C027A